MGKPKPPPGPDYNKLLQLTEMEIAANRELFNEYMTFARERADQQDALAEDYYNLIRPHMESELEMASLMRSRYLTQGIPFEDAYLEQITNWDTRERRDQRAAAAAADVNSAVEAARRKEEQRLAAFGIDPSQVRASSLDKAIATEGAVQAAAAATRARQQVEQEGIGLKSDALNVVRGMPSQAIASLGAGSQAGLGGINAMGQAAQFAGQSYATGSGILTGGAQLRNQAYNVASGIYGNQIDVWKTQMANSPAAVLGGVLGTIAGRFPFNQGGVVPAIMSPSGGAVPDDVPAALDAGEFVLPREAVQWHGLKALSRMVAEAKDNMPTARTVLPVPMQPGQAARPRPLL